jgi:hypothetical protein
MKPRVPLLLAVLAVVGAAAAVLANQAPPPALLRPQPPPPTVPVGIVLDDKAREPTLELPRKLVSSLRAAADGADDGTRRAEAAPVWRTVVGGLALSSALALGGLWLVRSRGRGGPKALALLVAAVGILAVGSSLLWADIPPFPRGRPAGGPPPRPIVVPGIPLSEKVTVQVVDGDAIRLIVSREQLAKVLEQSAPAKDKAPAPQK